MLREEEHLISMKKTTVYIISVSFILSIVSFIIGIKTDISLGDDPFHYQFASDWAKKGERPVYAESMHTVEGVYYRVYENAPFWPFNRAILQKRKRSNNYFCSK